MNLTNNSYIFSLNMIHIKIQCQAFLNTHHMPAPTYQNTTFGLAKIKVSFNESNYYVKYNLCRDIIWLKTTCYCLLTKRLYRKVY